MGLIFDEDNHMILMFGTLFFCFTTVALAIALVYQRRQRNHSNTTSSLSKVFRRKSPARHCIDLDCDRTPECIYDWQSDDGRSSVIKDYSVKCGCGLRGPLANSEKQAWAEWEKIATYAEQTDAIANKKTSIASKSKRVA